MDLPGFLRELQSTGGCADAAMAEEGLPPEAASLTAFREPVNQSDKLFKLCIIASPFFIFFLFYDETRKLYFKWYYFICTILSINVYRQRFSDLSIIQSINRLK